MVVVVVRSLGFFETNDHVISSSPSLSLSLSVDEAVDVVVDVWVAAASGFTEARVLVVGLVVWVG